MCSLAVLVLSVALSSTLFPASAEDQQMTGTVVERSPCCLSIENSKKEQITFHMEAGKPKVGEKVTVYYDPSQHDHAGRPFVQKVEKAGNARKGSTKN
jgi:hypothetical protein